MLDAQAALSSIAPVISLSRSSQVVAPASSVSLDASAASPGGRSIIGYAWRASASNPYPVSLFNANTPNASFVAPARGTYQFTLTVRDSAGATSTASASVRVNSLPVVQAVAAKSVVVGKTLKLALKATDADGDKLVFHAISLPAGATLSSSGTFSWAYAVPVGSYSVSVAASDADGSGPATSFTIDVNAESGAPVTLTTSNGGGSGGGGAMDEGVVLSAAGLLLIRRRLTAKK